MIDLIVDQVENSEKLDDLEMHSLERLVVKNAVKDVIADLVVNAVRDLIVDQVVNAEKLDDLYMHSLERLVK